MMALVRLTVRWAPLLITSVLLGCTSASPLGTSLVSATPATVSANGSLVASPNGLRVSLAPSASATVAPSSFKSTVYGYSVAVPAGWSSRPATVRWDGVSGVKSDSPEVDVLTSGGSASAWASSAPYAKDLPAYAKKTVADTAKYHGDTCTSPPEARGPITIGGEPGKLLSYNCGILINLAVALHNGVGYTFGFRDPAVQAATDATDFEVFTGLLMSVEFPR